MTDGLRKSHLRKAPQVGLSEVGLPDIYQMRQPESTTKLLLIYHHIMFTFIISVPQKTHIHKGLLD